MQVRKCDNRVGKSEVCGRVTSYFMKCINGMKSNLSLMTLPRHDDTTMTPAVVAMTAWMEDTSLRKRHEKRLRDKGHIQ